MQATERFNQASPQVDCNADLVRIDWKAKSITRDLVTATPPSVSVLPTSRAAAVGAIHGAVHLDSNPEKVYRSSNADFRCRGESIEDRAHGA